MLSLEIREALGIGPLDPPPWLASMRRLGLPPAYLRAVRAAPQQEKQRQQQGSPQASGSLGDFIEMAADDAKDAARGKVVAWESTAHFPGINAPLPAGADSARWEDPPQPPPPSQGRRVSGSAPQLGPPRLEPPQPPLPPPQQWHSKQQQPPPQWHQAASQALQVGASSSDPAHLFASCYASQQQHYQHYQQQHFQQQYYQQQQPVYGWQHGAMLPGPPTADVLPQPASQGAWGQQPSLQPMHPALTHVQPQLPPDLPYMWQSHV